MRLVRLIVLCAALALFPAAAALAQQSNTRPDDSTVIDSSKPETARDSQANAPETVHDDRSNTPETARDDPAKGPETAKDEPPASDVRRAAEAAKRRARPNPAPPKNP
jgi:hypothetical protein